MSQDTPMFASKAKIKGFLKFFPPFRIDSFEIFFSKTLYFSLGPHKLKKKCNRLPICILNMFRKLGNKNYITTILLFDGALNF